MTWDKRLFDLFLATVLSLILAVPMILILILLLITQGRPLFYVAERMNRVDRAFNLWKLRTMVAAEDDSGVSGGDKIQRVTRAGVILRAKRLDEIPQLWNIFKGDLSFVGPRPPLRQYVEQFPELYAEVLKCSPGVTGLASLVYHEHEAMLLARCKTREETDIVYKRSCIPRKARLDLIYQNHRNICFDLLLVLRTSAIVFGRKR